MPEAYAKLIPELTNPIYKYSAEGAGEFSFNIDKKISFIIKKEVKIKERNIDRYLSYLNIK